MGSSAVEYKKLFPQNRIPTILSCLLKAGTTLQKKTPYDLEDHLTRRLCARLILFSIFRDGPLGIHPQQEILSFDQDADKPTGRIDILISCGRGFHVYFAIEAKRLRTISPKGKSVAGNIEYINEGMMRFVTGQYAPLMESGAMLGYVFDKNIIKARLGIDRYLKKKEKELKLIPPMKLIISKILPNEQISFTNHNLDNRKFKIYHAFLAV
jgi:hypothetical protein